MKLSELHTGEKGIIVKVYGHGGFRKRLIEMGFIRGKEIKVLLNAPLQDPVKYLLMGYEVSLRHDEAEHIQVVTLEEAKKIDLSGNDFSGISVEDDEEESVMRAAAVKRRHHINVALVGNPNCGKTSLFNFASGAHERVGNYSGVTVSATEGMAQYEGYEFHLVDLPGTYSLSTYSPEEIYVRRQIIDKTPDVVLNVLDASNLERNLYLTTQLIDMNLRMVCALNMFDETERRGDNIDHKRLSNLLAVPMVPTVFKTGRGVEELFHTIIELYEGRIQEGHIHVNHGTYVEQGIDSLRAILRQDTMVKQRYTPRFLAIKYLEGDKEAENFVSTLANAEELRKVREHAAKVIEKELKTDAETAIMDAKYGFVNGALQEAEFGVGTKEDTYKVTHLIDHVITHRYMGFPFFIFLMYMMFQVTFTLGQYPMDWIDAGVTLFGDVVAKTMPDGMLKDMIADGIIGGVGAVIVFLPQILILYAFISYMEDSGYMARAAFIMDKLMHKIGLHGKSFIPLIMGFGCNVPAVMATRTIESTRSRLITMMILPFISCSARLPIIFMIVGTFFDKRYQTAVVVGLYVFGIIVAAVMGRLLSRYVVKGEDTPFVMELPPYRFPQAKSIMRHTWEKGREYLRKMGGIILFSSIIVWALGYFPHDASLSVEQQQEQSYIGKIGKTIEPVFAPQGFNWKLDMGLLAGIGAKEIVASTIGVLYAGEEYDSESDDNTLVLYEKMSSDGVTPASALAFLVFVLLYFPCLATVIAIKNESGSWKWTAFVMVYTTAVAWMLSAVVYQVGTLVM